MPIGPRDFVLEIIVPALLALAAMSIAWRPWRRFPRTNGHWGGALSVGLAVLAAYPAAMGAWPKFPPTDANQRLFYVTIVALLAGLLDALFHPPRWVSSLIALVASAATLGFMVKFKLFADWSPVASIGMLLLFALIGAIWWVTLEAMADERGAVISVALWIITSSIAVIFMLLDSLSWGKLSLSLAAAAGALFVMLAWRPSIRLSHGAVQVYVILLLCLIIPSHYLASVSYGYVLTLLAAPVFLWVGWLLAAASPIARWRPWQRAAIRIVVLAIPMAILLSVAAVGFRRNSGDGSNGPESDPYGLIDTSASTSIEQRAISGELARVSLTCHAYSYSW